MAYYENLPIYKKTMELAVFMETVVRTFSRYHKYAIGAELRDQSRRLFTLVIRANSRRDKISALTELRDSGEEMKALIVMAKEVKAFTYLSEQGYCANGLKRRVVTEKLTFCGGMV